MPNIGTVLREEIIRLSRREGRSQIDPTKKSTAQHRRDIALLKRQVTQLERRVALLTRKVPRLVLSRDVLSGWVAAQPRLAVCNSQ